MNHNGVEINQNFSENLKISKKNNKSFFIYTYLLRKFGWQTMERTQWDEVLRFFQNTAIANQVRYFEHILRESTIRQ